MKTDVCIVGGGAGGVFSSLYLKRFAIDSVIIEKREIGGLIKYANYVENFPFLKPATGIEVAEKIKNIVFESSLKFLNDTVINIEHRDNFFEIKTSSGLSIFSSYLILATGTIPFIPDEFNKVKDLVNDFEDKFFNFKNIKIGIVGGGDVAFDYALNLSKRDNKVTVISRNIRAFELLVKRCYKSGIQVLNKCLIKNVFLNNQRFYLEIFNGDFIKLDFDYIIPACGRLPFYGNIENINKIINDKRFENKFFLCGDVKNQRCRYLINAISDAINISLKIKEAFYESNCRMWKR
jgi:thioredoxin reductase (NADPH)